VQLSYLPKYPTETRGVLSRIYKLYPQYNHKFLILQLIPRYGEEAASVDGLAFETFGAFLAVVVEDTPWIVAI
jgi:hypothetical protein